MYAKLNWNLRGAQAHRSLPLDVEENARSQGYCFDQSAAKPENPVLSTVFLYNKSSNIMISFDDAKSFAAKGDFISKLGLRGFSVWHVNGDSSDNILLGSIRNSTSGVSLLAEHVWTSGRRLNNRTPELPPPYRISL
ncbi:hypothetical protein C8J57DRAFT_1620956 [Mycena rebaudengoi]|nr:hypothetical protein C8J57DRAFT_1620956 [Mycena rebaudengoi]